jgi:hypothetical protein
MTITAPRLSEMTDASLRADVAVLDRLFDRATHPLPLEALLVRNAYAAEIERRSSPRSQGSIHLTCMSCDEVKEMLSPVRGGVACGCGNEMEGF